MEVTKKAAEDVASTAVQKKRRYQQPFLKRYGSVKTLTASGSGTDVENGPNPVGMCDSDPFKRSCN